MIPDKVYFLDGILTLKPIPKATAYVKETRLEAAMTLLEAIDDSYALAEITGFSVGKVQDLLDIVLEIDTL